MKWEEISNGLGCCMMKEPSGERVELGKDWWGFEEAEAIAMELGSLLDTLKQTGFKAAANVDEDFPAIKGEYGAKVTVCKPALDKETKEQLGYQLTLKISNTLTGDTADGRLLTRWYRLDGNDFSGQPLTAEAKAESLKDMFNDAFTIGVQLDGSTQQTLEESFAGLFDRPCFIRAWHFSPKAEPDRKIQQFVIKQEKDLKKDAKETKAGKSARAPF